MKILKTLIFFNLVLNYAVCYSQNTKMNRDIEKIIALGKDSVIQLALELINESNTINTEVNKESFSKIEVSTNGKEIKLLFKNSIEYLPKKTVFIGSLSVQLLANIINKNIVSNPPDDLNNISKDHIPLYKETKEIKKTQRFIFDAINKSEIGSIKNRLDYRGNMTILEGSNYYDVVEYSKSGKSSYKIKKKSGKIYDIMQKQYLYKAVRHPMGNENKYEDIHWDKH